MTDLKKMIEPHTSPCYQDDMQRVWPPNKEEPEPTVGGKNSFLVFKEGKYSTVPIKNIAFFHMKYASPMIVCFDRKEYSVNYSLRQIEHLVAARQFFRLNKQYLINFDAIKEVEHYYGRKLLIRPIVESADPLLVPKEKSTRFLHWLEDR